MSSITSSTVTTQRNVSKNNARKKSLRQIVKHQNNETHHEEIDEDTFEFTQIENVKHFNGLPRVSHRHDSPVNLQIDASLQVITSTPKTGKSNQSHTVVDTGRMKTNDPIQKRRPSKRTVRNRHRSSYLDDASL
jgi:uncharacterized membrane protein YfhO